MGSAKNLCNLDDYTALFVQRHPCFAIKSKNGWKTRNYPLTDEHVKKHLNKELIVGSVSRWYPAFGILDMDDVQRNYAERLRHDLGLNETNSMLFSSESENSYHLLFRPLYNGKPPTINLLQNVFKLFAKEHGIEIYPQKQRKVRLPFGMFQECLDYEYQNYKTWQEKLYWFNKLDDFDLKGVKNHQSEFRFFVSNKNSGLILQSTTSHNKSCFQEGAELFQHGLQYPSSRHESQFKVIYYLWRYGVALDETIRRVWTWINKKHNNFSKDIVNKPKIVKYEIERQANKVYTDYEFKSVFPDNTHNQHNGYICKPDMEEIIEICGGSLPRMRFLFNLVKYSYPRRYKTFLSVHSDRFIEWSSKRTYLEYLNELNEKRIVQRGSAYSTDNFAKSLKLKWNYRSSDSAVMHEGRAVETFNDAIRLVYQPSDFRDLIKRSGKSRQMASHITNQVFNTLRVSNNVETYNK